MPALSGIPTIHVKPHVGCANPSLPELAQSTGMRKKPRPKIACRIAKLRSDRGVNQMAAADAIGISRSTLANIESGGDLPGRETLKAIADYYQVSVDFLLDGDVPSGIIIADADERRLVQFCAA